MPMTTRSVPSSAASSSSTSSMGINVSAPSRLKRLCPTYFEWRNRSNPSAAFSLSRMWRRSEEHTSELQSRGHIVCRLLLEKKKRAKSTTQLYYPKRRQGIPRPIDAHFVSRPHLLEFPSDVPLLRPIHTPPTNHSAQLSVLQ